MNECILWFDNVEIMNNYYGLLCKVFTRDFVREFKAICISPKDECTFDDKWNKFIDKIEAFSYDEYWDQFNDMEHKLISSRWVSGCGMLTRIYIRYDGAIVFSHCQIGYSGVHVLYPKEYIRKYIKEKVILSG